MKDSTGGKMKKGSLALLALAVALAITPAARAGQIVFSFSGGGISSSGWFIVAPTATPGVDEVTGIGGTFTDTNVGISGTITGLYDPSYSILPPASSPAGMSYDDLFYPGGNSPAVCPGYPFSGGVFDVYGVLFNVTGGYMGEIWSDGNIPGAGLVYGAGDSNATTILDLPGQGLGVPVTLSTAPVPEPGSLVLLGTGLLGIIAVLAPKGKPSSAVPNV